MEQTQDGVGKRRFVEREPDENRELRSVGRRETEPVDGGLETVEVLVQTERPARVDAQRLERRPPALEPLFVDL